MLLVVASASAWALSESAPTCAVLTFQMGPGISPGESGLLANRVSSLLERSGTYRVIPRRDVNRQLAASGVFPVSTTYTMAAGLVLGTDYLIAGHVAKVEGGFTLWMTLWDVANSRPVGEAEHTSPGGMDVFGETVSRECLSDLMGVPVPAPMAAPVAAIRSIAPEPVAMTAPSVPIVREPIPVVSPPPLRRPPPAISEKRPAVPPPRVATDFERRSWADTTRSAGSAFLETVSGKLEVGTRITSFSLDTTSSGPETTFIGTIIRLEEEQDRSPTKLYLRYFFRPWIGVELAHDGVKAYTVTSEDGHSDGSFSAKGPIVSVIGRASLRDIAHGCSRVADRGDPAWAASEWAARVRPFLQVGMAMLSGEFEPESWWALGYASKETWKELGSPTTRRKGRYRTMDVSSSTGTILALGCDATITDHFAVNVFWRTMAAELDAALDYTGQPVGRPRKSGTVPLDNTAFGVGVGYVF